MRFIWNVNSWETRESHRSYFNNLIKTLQVGVVTTSMHFTYINNLHLHCTFTSRECHQSWIPGFRNVMNKTVPRWTQPQARLQWECYSSRKRDVTLRTVRSVAPQAKERVAIVKKFAPKVPIHIVDTNIGFKLLRMSISVWWVSKFSCRQFLGQLQLREAHFQEADTFLHFVNRMWLWLLYF